MSKVKLSDIKYSTENLVEINEQNKRNIQNSQNQINMYSQVLSRSSNFTNKAQMAYNKALADREHRLREINSQNAEGWGGVKTLESHYNNEVLRTRKEYDNALNEHKRNLLAFEQAHNTLKINTENYEKSRAKLKDATFEIEQVIENIATAKSNALGLTSLDYSQNAEGFISQLNSSQRNATDLLNTVLESLGMDRVSYQDDTPSGGGMGSKVKSLYSKSGPNGMSNSYGESFIGETAGAYSLGNGSLSTTINSNFGNSDHKISETALTPMQRLSNYMNSHNYSKDNYFEYSNDPEWKDLHRNAFPDLYKKRVAQATALIANSAKWSKYNIAPSIEDLLARSNPNYSQKSASYSRNCQRCVPTYEAMKRGYDVTAKPIPSAFDHLSYYPYDVWKDPVVFNTSGDGCSDICNKMAEWGDGSRAQVVVYWNNNTGGHTFVAEQINGVTHFIDSQTGNKNCINYFNNVKIGQTTFCRIDNLEFSNNIVECCKGANI